MLCKTDDINFQCLENHAAQENKSQIKSGCSSHDNSFHNISWVALYDVLCVPGVRELESPWEGSPGMAAEQADAISRDSGRGVAGKDLRQAIVKGGSNRGFKGGTITSGSDPSNTPERAVAQPCGTYGANHTGMWGAWKWCHGLEKNWITEKCKGDRAIFAATVCIFLQSKPQWLPVQFPLWTPGTVPLPFSRCVPCLLCRARMLKDICSHMEALAQAHFGVKTECLRPMVVTRENVHKFSCRQALCNWTSKLY